MVVGRTRVNYTGGWIRRVRASMRLAVRLFLRRRCGTAFIRASDDGCPNIYTHPLARISPCLCERHYPNLVTQECSANSDGITQPAGNAARGTGDGPLSPRICPLRSRWRELGNRLLLPVIRQMRCATAARYWSITRAVSTRRVTKAISLMESTWTIRWHVRVDAARGLSTRRSGARLSRDLWTNPARFYKRLRVRRARAYDRGIRYPADVCKRCNRILLRIMRSAGVRDEYRSAHLPECGRAKQRSD